MAKKPSHAVATSTLPVPVPMNTDSPEWAESRRRDARAFVSIPDLGPRY